MVLPVCRGGVDDKVEAAFEERARLGEAAEGRDHVVPLGAAGAGGVEVERHGGRMLGLSAGRKKGAAWAPPSRPRPGRRWQVVRDRMLSVWQFIGHALRGR